MIDNMLLIIISFFMLWIFLLAASIYAIYKLTEGERCG